MAVSVTPIIPHSLINADAALIQGALNAIPAIFKISWPLLIIMAIVIIAKASFKIHHYYIISKAGMHEIDKMSGTDFEIFLTSLFSRLGYKSEHVGHTGDYGVDVIAESEGKKFAIQAKRYGSKNKTGEDAIREALAGIKMYNCTNAMVVTNSFFTPMAKKLAKTNDIEIWHRFDLAKAIILANKLNPNP